MNTESCYIAVKSGDYIESIFVYADGGIFETGQILLTKYKDINKINKLINLGSLYRLGENIGHQVDMRDYIKSGERKQCVAAHRDNKYPLLIDCFFTWAEFEQYIKNAKYVYLYDTEVEKWFVNVSINNLLKVTFKELKKVLN